MAEQPRRIPRSILVGSDLSPASDRVVETAERLARTAAAELHVICSYSPPRSGFPSDPAPSTPEGVLSEVRDALPAQLRRILAKSRPPTSQEVRFGPPADIILERGREVSADLIVLGAHRGTDVNAQFLGTTADSVLRRTGVPCLAVRGVITLPLRTMAVAVDLDEEGREALRAAFDWAAWLARPDGSESAAAVRVRVVHVVAGGQGSGGTAAAELERFVDAVGGDRAKDGVDVSTDVIVDPDPASALPRWADRAGAELLVLGTRSDGERARPHLGSTSAAVARRAPCPVLLVPDRASGDP